MIFFYLSVTSLGRKALNVASIICEIGFTLNIKILNSEQDFFVIKFVACYFSVLYCDYFIPVNSPRT